MSMTTKNSSQLSVACNDNNDNNDNIDNNNNGNINNKEIRRKEDGKLMDVNYNVRPKKLTLVSTVSTSQTQSDKSTQSDKQSQSNERSPSNTQLKQSPPTQHTTQSISPQKIRSQTSIVSNDNNFGSWNLDDDDEFNFNFDDDFNDNKQVSPINTQKSIGNKPKKRKKRKKFA